jgi:hypothetical protein
MEKFNRLLIAYTGRRKRESNIDVEVLHNNLCCEKKRTGRREYGVVK